MPRYKRRATYACPVCGAAGQQLWTKKNAGAKNWQRRCTCSEALVFFASHREHTRFCELLVLQRAGQISHLKLQPRMPLVVNRVEVGKYTPDFCYMEADGEVFEDVKGYAGDTEATRFRIKVFEACYNTTVRVVR